MAKIKAVLDQETWSEVDVPDEFQAIVTSLCFVEPVGTGDFDDASSSIATDNSESVSRNAGSPKADSQVSSSLQPIDRTNSTGASPDSTTQANVSPFSGPADNNRADVLTSSAPSNNGNKKDRTLSFRGVAYHMANWLVFLITVFLLHIISVLLEYFSIITIIIYPASRCLFASETFLITADFSVLINSQCLRDFPSNWIFLFVVLFSLFLIS